MICGLKPPWPCIVMAHGPWSGSCEQFSSELPGTTYVDVDIGLVVCTKGSNSGYACSLLSEPPRAHGFVISPKT